MARVKLRLDSKKDLDSVLNDSLAQRVGKTVKEMIISMCSRGVSPVQGQGRFTKYKDTDKYPQNVRDEYPGKRKSPVNLILSGAMLEAIETFRNGNKLRLGIFNGSPQLNKAAAHNEGEGRMPRRAFIPSRSGEEFARTIMRAIVDLYNTRVKDILTRSK